MKNFGLLIVILLLAGTMLSSTLVIKGSNTVYPVAQLWAEGFNLSKAPGPRRVSRPYSTDRPTLQIPVDGSRPRKLNR